MKNLSEFVNLCNTVLEGNATAAQLEQLRELLHRDEAYRHAYQEQVKVHAYLTWQHGRASINEPIVTPPISTSPAKPRNWTAPMLGLALSLLIVVGGLTTWWQWNLARVPLVVISSTDPTYVKGARVFLDSVHLRQGTFRFRLDSGAEVEAVGPVDFELLSDMHLRIVQGSVTVDVGDDAIGFQVDTAEANIVDLGTRFGVSVSDAGQTDVVVFEGEVDVHPPSAKPQPKDRIANLKEGEAIRIDKSSVPKRLTSVVIRGDWNEVLEGSNHPSPVIVDLTDNGVHKQENRCYSVRAGGLRPSTRSYVGLGRPKWEPMPGQAFPEDMLGADVVLMYSRDRFYPQLEYYLHVSAPSRIFVWHDSRLATPDWLTDEFQKTDMKLRSSPWHTSNDIVSNLDNLDSDEVFVEYEVWQRDVPAGIVTLGGNHNRSRSWRFAMYGIAAKALD